MESDGFNSPVNTFCGFRDSSKSISWMLSISFLSLVAFSQMSCSLALFCSLAMFFCNIYSGWVYQTSYNYLLLVFVSFNFFSIWILFHKHESQDCRGRGRAFLELLTTTSTGFTDTLALAGQLMQRAHLCT